MRIDGAGYVAARKLIPQNPLDDAPDVPRGTRGHVDDEADDLFLGRLRRALRRRSL
jgi:hypothetical protein